MRRCVCGPAIPEHTNAVYNIASHSHCAWVCACLKVCVAVWIYYIVLYTHTHIILHELMISRCLCDVAFFRIRWYLISELRLGAELQKWAHNARQFETSCLHECSIAVLVLMNPHESVSWQHHAPKHKHCLFLSKNKLWNEILY